MARLLERRGAVVLDADDLARRAVDPGTPGYERVVERFGQPVVSASGKVDREALGRLVFADPEGRKDLELIVHPEVFRLLLEGLEPYRTTGRIVVFDAPLIAETGIKRASDILVVVTAPIEARVARVMAERGMTEDAVRARIAVQASDDEKESLADYVVHNDGTLEDLEGEVERLWDELTRLATTKDTAP